MVAQAIQGQIGMLTCQVIEMGVQIQIQGMEIAHLKEVLATASSQTPPPPSPS